MSNTGPQFKDAYLEARAAFGVGITFGTHDEIQAIVAESRLSRELARGGFQEDAEFTARVLLEDLPSAPALGSLVTYEGMLLKVKYRALQPGHPIGEFTLAARKR